MCVCVCARARVCVCVSSTKCKGNPKFKYKKCRRHGASLLSNEATGVRWRTLKCVPAGWTETLSTMFVTYSYSKPFMVHTGIADAWLQRFLLRLVNSVWSGLPQVSPMSSRVLRAGVTDHPGLRAWCACACGYGCGCVCIYIYIYVCVCVCVSVRVNVCVCVCFSLSLSLSLSLSVWLAFSLISCIYALELPRVRCHLCWLIWVFNHWRVDLRLCHPRRTQPTRGSSKPHCSAGGPSFWCTGVNITTNTMVPYSFYSCGTTYRKYTST